MSDKAQRLWLRGLVGALIAGAAHAVTGAAVAPETFNFNDGFLKLLQLSTLSGVVSAAFYLQKSPLPPEDDDHDNSNPKT